MDIKLFDGFVNLKSYVEKIEKRCVLTFFVNYFFQSQIRKLKLYPLDADRCCAYFSILEVGIVFTGKKKQPFLCFAFAFCVKV